MQRISKHPCLTHPAAIQAICQPLLKLYINYFAHVQIDNERRFSAITNHPLYTEHYLKNQFYNIDIHTADWAVSEKYIVWDAIELTGQSANENLLAAQFGVEHIFTLMEKDRNGISYYHFGSNLLGKAINQVYVSNINLLTLFIEYFKEKISNDKIISRSYDMKFPISEAAEGFSTTTRDVALDQRFIRENFLADVQKVSLSAREWEMLRWLHHGKTAREIAEILQLADVTVHKHLSNIKSKTRCYTQFQLGEFFQKNYGQISLK
jgi:DNA-binding NarL/FixJ family response regulator